MNEVDDSSNQVPGEPSRRWGRFFLFTLVVMGVVGNLVALDYLMYLQMSDKLVVSPTAFLESSLTRLEERVDALAEEVGRIATSSTSQGEATVSSTPIVQERTVVEKVVREVSTSSVKEFYVPLGSASVATENYTWVDTGAEAVVDPGNYNDISQVTFEATLFVPAGKVEARLYNVSDSYPIYGAVLVAEGAPAKLYRSGNIALPAGSKTYRVQMRTSLNYTGTMDNAKIRILVQ